MIRALAVIAVAALLPPAQSPQPLRDTARPAPTGTATIAGVVLSDESSPRPLRRARVAIGGPTIPLGRVVITQDDGSFSFDGLAPGRYTVGGSKDGYVAMRHGATRPARPGAPIVLRAGESRRVTLRLPRGAVITGTVTTPDGQPAAGVTVSALTNRYTPSTGEHRLTAVTMNPAETDERGVYRIHGLAAGDYVVSAYVRGAPGMTEEVQVLSNADIQRALAESSSASQKTAPALPRRVVVLAPVFFPGTPVASQATFVTLGKSEERAGIDIQLQYAPTALVEGAVFSPQPGAINVLLSSPATTPGIPTDFRSQQRVKADGRFSIAGVPPGHYTLSASARFPPAAPGGSPSVLWASTELTVDGEDISNVMLTLAPGIRLSGRVAFEGEQLPSVDFGSLRLSIPIARTGSGAFAGSSAFVPIPPLQIDASDRFALDGIVPGIYRLGANIRGLREPVGRWWLKSIAIGGREVLDVPLDLRQSMDDALVIFSDRASALTGVLRDEAGEPVADAWVVAFATHPAAWFHNSRRIAAVKAGTDGSYAFRNLPAGEYHIMAAFDLESGEWFDTTVLKALIPVSARVTIAEYEQKTADVTYMSR